ncbi:hypothetical protein [Bacillus sp. EB600]|uniref:hypothetical protein n=1 Tax=Bacillus sp. EB600 TaxID=2806345 RepID=UPI00210C5DE5|nr:hypothetical protein [Bacillus sp. EB600]MCQ6278646.1 hypothetical protein [Bacillus sp. EB600]
MGGLTLLHFILWKLFDVFKEFIIFYVFILLGEWFVQKKGYNLFTKAWVITMIALSILTFVVWAHFGRLLIFL